MVDQDNDSTQYTPFPSFAEWVTPPLSYPAVDDLSGALAQLRDIPQPVRAEAVRAVRNAAAIETGAIEKLYDLDRGITITAALQGAHLESVLQKQSEKAKGLIESQMAAYDFVLDFVTKRQPLAAAWLRALHTQLCASQKTYQVRLETGELAESSLPLGEYKTRPNHVQTATGVHYYAPVIDTQAEVDRLIHELSSPEFETAHAVEQTSYAHYGMVAIHPFADGNGRVARAFASVYTYRQHGVPLLITADQRAEYFRALARADSGHSPEFRNFLAARIVQSVRLMLTSVSAAKRGSIVERVGTLKRVYETRGGYLQVDIDTAGYAILETLKSQLETQAEPYRSSFPGLHMSVGDAQASRAVGSDEHRPLVRYPDRLVRLQAQSNAPAEASTITDLGVEVPKDATGFDVFRVVSGNGMPLLELAVGDVLPERGVVVDIQLALFASEVISATLQNLEALSRESLRKKGYTVTAGAQS